MKLKSFMRRTEVVPLILRYFVATRDVDRHVPSVSRTIYFPAGVLLVSLGLVCYAFLQTRKNYYLVHSLWHICVAIGVILLLPKRKYMK